MALNKHSNLDQKSRDKLRYLDKKIITLSDRKAICLRDYLSDNVDGKFSELPFTNLQKCLASELFKYDDCLNLIDEGLLISGSSLGPEENFQWLINDLRAQIFTLNVMQNNEPFNSTLDYYGSSVIDNLYSYFDFLRFNGEPLELDHKVDLLARAKIIWDAVREKDRYSKWLKDDNEKQIEKARKSLEKDKLYVDANIDNSNYSEIRSRVLASIDLIDHPTDVATSRNYEQSDTKVLFISNMKNVWVQQNRRDEGKTKKPFHLPLTLSTHANLEELAKFNNLTTPKQLEELINSAHKKIFFDDDGKRKYYT